METDLITVIVPVYNVEKYIRRCVTSIVDQTYKNLQIILIDDGSTDGSGTICDEIATWDNRIEVIHKQNGGLSDARNTGIKNARGSLIGFVDGDDYIEEDMYEILQCEFANKKTDIVSCGICEEFENKTKIICYSAEKCELNRKQAYEALFAHVCILGCSSCNKLFSANLFENIYYKKNIQSEDLELLYRILNRVNKVICVNKIGYHYVHREGSITTCPFQKKNMDVIYTMENVVEFIKENHPDLTLQVYAYQLVWLIGGIQSISRSDRAWENEKKYILNLMHKNLKYYWSNKYIYWGNYILFWAIMLHIYVPVKWLLDKCVTFYHSVQRKR